MKHRVVRRSLVVVAASLSVVAVGCGATGGATGSGGSGALVSSGAVPGAPTAASLAKAATTTAAVSSERVAITVETTPADGDPSISVTSTGELDAANGRAHLVAEISGSFGEHAEQATIETVYDGDTIYLKAPFLDMFGATKPWVKVTSPEIAAAVEELGGTVQPDPGEFLSFLEGAGGTVEELGTEELRGVPTRHVAVQVDIAKVLDEAAGEHRKDLEEHLTKHGVSLDGLAPLPAQAWIDDEGYVRKFSVSYDLDELASLHPGHSSAGDTADLPVITETIELYDFNEPVDIAVPPASEVSELDLPKFGN